MNIEEIREYCLSKPFATEDMPFDEDTITFKVELPNGKRPIFALISLSKPDYLLVKCDPDLAIELRERYPEDIEPGFHMNKRHWNGIWLGCSLIGNMVRGMIDDSYALVARKK